MPEREREGSWGFLVRVKEVGVVVDEGEGWDLLERLKFSLTPADGPEATLPLTVPLLCKFRPGSEGMTIICARIGYRSRGGYEEVET